MKKLCSLILILVLVALTTSGYAKTTFENVKQYIDAIAINGVDFFETPEDGSFREGDMYYTPNGMILSIFIDYPVELLVFTDNDSSNRAASSYGRRPDKKDSQPSSEIIEVLSVIANDYCEYNTGAKFTVCIGGTEEVDKPYVQLEYSPVISPVLDHNDTTQIALLQYNDIDLFLDACDFFCQRIIDHCAGLASVDIALLSLTVDKGQKGNSVKLLQSRLNELGYSVGTPDGDFGSKTVNAVKEFQTAHGMEPTGLCDPYTTVALFTDDISDESAELEQAAQSFVSSLDDESRNELIEAFSELDTDGDGTISYDELYK